MSAPFTCLQYDDNCYISYSKLLSHFQSQDRDAQSEWLDPCRYRSSSWMYEEHDALNEI